MRPAAAITIGQGHQQLPKRKAKVSFLNVKFKRVASQGDSSLIDRKEVTSSDE